MKEVTGAVCGYVGYVELKWDHRKGPGSEPDVWICETHK